MYSILDIYIGAGEASADVPEGEEEKVKDNEITEAVAEGIIQFFFVCLCDLVYFSEYNEFKT